MTRRIYSVRLKRTRQVLRAGQSARQIAGLLGFENSQQIAISAAVFALAYKAVVEYRTARLRLLLSNQFLLIRCSFADAEDREVRSAECGKKKEEGLRSSLFRIGQRPLNSGDFGHLLMERGKTTLTYPLPAKSPRLDAADLPWIIREMGRITPLDPLEEFYQLSRELLRLLRLARVDFTSESRKGHAA